MVSSSFSISDNESSSSSTNSCVNTTTLITKTLLPPPPPPPPNNFNFNCHDCYTSFPTHTALMEHQREKGPNHAKLGCEILNILRGGLKPQSIVMPLQPPTQQTPTFVSSRANLTTSRLPPSPMGSSLVPHANVSGNETSGAGYLNYHPYLRQETMPIGTPPSGDVDHGSDSQDMRTLDLISQLDPTRNLLSQLENNQFGAQSGNGSNGGTSKWNGFVDLNLKL